MDRHCRRRTPGVDTSDYREDPHPEPTEAIMTNRANLTKEQLDAAYEVLIDLRRAFPEMISHLDVQKRRPLKIGIAKDIQTRLLEVPAEVIGHAMRIYCSDRRYLAGLIAGAPRVDLTGARCGEVTRDEANSAKLRLEALRRAQTRTPAKEAATVAEKQDKPKLGLAGLKAAARARSAAAQPSGSECRSK
jgi:ProP effector